MSFIVQAKDPVKIVQILDTNLFKTADGKIISLANVRTISIQDPDSFKQKFAFKIYGFAEKSLVNKVLFLEVATEHDSVLIIHLWDELLESVNRKFLQMGYGYFDPKPDSKYFGKYEIAADNAKRNELGIHNAELFCPKIPLKPNAFWISAGLGINKSYNYSKNWNSDGFAFELTGQIRRKLYIVSFGKQYVGLDEVTSLNSQHIMLGKSFYDRLGEAVLLIGINRNQWRHCTESEYGIIRSDYYYGLQFKAQAFVHLPQIIGFGLGFSANINREISYYILSVNVNIGLWNF